MWYKYLWLKLKKIVKLELLNYFKVINNFLIFLSKREIKIY